MLRDAVYLADILSAAADLRKFARSASLEEFCPNRTLRYAMLHALTVIGEASSKVSAELVSPGGLRNAEGRMTVLVDTVPHADAVRCRPKPATTS
jgi:hypothetical protein